MKPVLLLVEDNADEEALTLRAINGLPQPPQVLVAHDGPEALSLLKARDSLPRLILLDFRLPKLNGLEVLRSVRSDDELQDVKVVIFSSSDEQTDRAACQTAGADAFVTKPVDYEEYINAVRGILQQWLS